jgi:predicted phosphoadenosine phosphosulfate sulfurtransferase
MVSKIKEYVSSWERVCYVDGIPDEAPARLEQLHKVPSYRQLVKAIFKNDTTLKTLGITPKKPRAYHELKRIELAQRHPEQQLKFRFTYNNKSYERSQHHEVKRIG